jgi:dihydrofolate reductase
MKGFKAILAADEKLGIGKEGDLPWHVPGDLAYFKRMTVGQGNNAVIMGRLTWDSIPAKWRPLKDRRNIVLTTNRQLTIPHEEARVTYTFDEALKHAQAFDEIWVVGGGKIYAMAFEHPACEAIHVTLIKGDFQCDTHAPAFEQSFTRKSASDTHTDGPTPYQFTVWEPREN